MSISFRVEKVYHDDEIGTASTIQAVNDTDKSSLDLLEIHTFRKGRTILRKDPVWIQRFFQKRYNILTDSTHQKFIEKIISILNDVTYKKAILNFNIDSIRNDINMYSTSNKINDQRNEMEGIYDKISANKNRMNELTEDRKIYVLALNKIQGEIDDLRAGYEENKEDYLNYRINLYENKSIPQNLGKEYLVFLACSKEKESLERNYLLFSIYKEWSFFYYGNRDDYYYWRFRESSNNINNDHYEIDLNETDKFFDFTYLFDNVSRIFHKPFEIYGRSYCEENELIDLVSEQLGNVYIRNIDDLKKYNEYYICLDNLEKCNSEIRRLENYNKNLIYGRNHLEEIIEKNERDLERLRK